MVTCLKLGSGDIVVGDLENFDDGGSPLTLSKPCQLVPAEDGNGQTGFIFQRMPMDPVTVARSIVLFIGPLADPALLNGYQKKINGVVVASHMPRECPNQPR
jgi:hypothetical protein